MSLANLPDSDLIRPLGREEFDQLWDDALDPASTDQELSDIAQQELLRTQVIPAAFSLLGYDCAWGRLDARSSGAVHGRLRWFLLAARRASPEAAQRQK